MARRFSSSLDCESAQLPPLKVSQITSRLRLSVPVLPGHQTSSVVPKGPLSSTASFQTICSFVPGLLDSFSVFNGR
ncbi:hypothetical protein GOODEAATRI_022880 [Goodea atripinnis]|uniref:Uncharacterized protein n=1 Tax=Goodea atripinnis TaxID=208336 RepID=A0ABV0P743_9TELE